jgi:hypothetical protein
MALASVALVAALGAGGLALYRLASPEGGRAAGGSSPATATATAAADRAAPARSRDPLDAVPTELEGALGQVSRGEALDAAAIRALRAYQSAHPEDACAALLLAHDYARRAWWGGALERYEQAYARDPGARESRFFLDDLVRMTGSSARGDEAVAMIESVYGKSALPTLTRALDDRELDAEARRRLLPLVARLMADLR